MAGNDANNAKVTTGILLLTEGLWRMTVTTPLFFAALITVGVANAAFIGMFVRRLQTAHEPVWTGLGQLSLSRVNNLRKEARPFLFIFTFRYRALSDRRLTRLGDIIIACSVATGLLVLLYGLSAGSSSSHALPLI